MTLTGDGRGLRRVVLRSERHFMRVITWVGERVMVTPLLKRILDRHEELQHRLGKDPKVRVIADDLAQVLHHSSHFLRRPRT